MFRLETQTNLDDKIEVEAEIMKVGKNETLKKILKLRSKDISTVLFH